MARRHRHHAVLLVQGILGQEFVYWNLLKRYLKADEYHVHEVRLPFFGFGDLRKSAEHLGKIVDQVLQENPTETDDGRVDIVAHSAGGLAARFYVRYLGGLKKVHSLVTLGTPHYGTYVSYLFPVATVSRQTLPGSTFLQQLNRGNATPPPVNYTSIYTVNDGVVLPPSSAILKGAENVRVPGLTTHWGFLVRPAVYRTIRRALKHPLRASGPRRSRRAPSPP